MKSLMSSARPNVRGSSWRSPPRETKTGIPSPGGSGLGSGAHGTPTVPSIGASSSGSATGEPPSYTAHHIARTLARECRQGERTVISQFNPKDARFLGTPLDFVVFDGL